MLNLKSSDNSCERFKSNKKENSHKKYMEEINMIGKKPKDSANKLLTGMLTQIQKDFDFKELVNTDNSNKRFPKKKESKPKPKKNLLAHNTNIQKYSEFNKLFKDDINEVNTKKKFKYKISVESFDKDHFKYETQISPINKGNMSVHKLSYSSKKKHSFNSTSKEPKKESGINLIKHTNTSDTNQMKHKHMDSIFNFMKTPEKYKNSNKFSATNLANNNQNFSHLLERKLTKKNIKEVNQIKADLKKSFLIDDEHYSNFSSSSSSISDSNDRNKQLKEELIDLNNEYMNSSVENENTLKIETTKKSEFYDKTDTNTINDDEYIDKLFAELEYRCLKKKDYIYDSVDDEEFEDEIDDDNYINPNCLFIKIFKCIILIQAILSFYIIPYKLAHDLDLDCKPNFKQSFSFMLFFDFFADFTFILDIFLNFFIGYYTNEDVLILSLRNIVYNYTHTWFLLDLITGIPFNSIFHILSFNCKHSHPKFYTTGTKEFYNIFSYLRTFKIVKELSSNIIVKHILESLIKNVNCYTKWKDVLYIAFYFVSCLHIMGCFYIFIGQMSYPNWILQHNYKTTKFLHIYITSMYFILTSVTTCGYGDITFVNNYELVTVIILLIIGINIYSWGLSAVSDYIKNQDSKTMSYKQNCEILDEIKLSHKNMSIELYDKISRHLKYEFLNEKKDKNIIIDSLPISLRNDLIFEMYKPIIKNFIFFKRFDNLDFVVRVIMAFKPILALKSDILINEGEYVKEVIFVKKGILSLEIPLLEDEEDTLTNKYSTKRTFSLKKTETIRNNLTMKKLKGSHFSKHDDFLKSKEQKAEVKYVRLLNIRQNEHFGDILMFLNKKSPLNLKVTSKEAKLFFLMKEDAIPISIDYPQIWKKICKASLFNMEQMEILIKKANQIYKNADKKRLKYKLKNESKKSTIVHIKKEFEHYKTDIYENLNNSFILQSTYNKDFMQESFNDSKDLNKSEIIQENLNFNSESNDSDFNDNFRLKSIPNVSVLNEEEDDKNENSEELQNNFCNKKNFNEMSAVIEEKEDSKECSCNNEKSNKLALNSDNFYNKSDSESSISADSSSSSNSDPSSSIFPSNNNSKYVASSKRSDSKEILLKDTQIINQPLTLDDQIKEFLKCEERQLCSNTSEKLDSSVNNASLVVSNGAFNKLTSFGNLQIAKVENFKIKKAYENLNKISNNTYIANKDLQKKVKKLIATKSNLNSNVSSSINFKNNSNVNKLSNISISKKIYEDFSPINKKSFVVSENKKSTIRKTSLKPNKFNDVSNQLKVKKRMSCANLLSSNIMINSTFSKSSQGFLNNQKTKKVQQSDAMDQISNAIMDNYYNLNLPEKYFSSVFKQALQNNNNTNNNNFNNNINNNIISSSNFNQSNFSFMNNNNNMFYSQVGNNKNAMDNNSFNNNKKNVS